MKLEEWQQIGLEKFGMDAMKWKFKCPDCGLVQCGQDFLDLGLWYDQVITFAGYTCLDRWKQQQCLSYGKGPVSVELSVGEFRPTFEFADD